MQRLKERQQVLVMVGERMAVCTVLGFHDGKAVLRTTERQRGGPMPEFSDDAQLTFEYGPNLVMLNGTLEHGFTEGDLIFSVSDGVQVLKGGEHTGAKPGRVVRGPGWKGWKAE